MEQTPKISVIIPCYYTEKSTGKAVLVLSLIHI